MDIKTRITEFSKGIGIFFIFISVPIFFHLLLSDFFTNNLTRIFSQLIVLIIFVLLFNKTLMNDFKDLKKNYKSLLKYSLKIWFYGLLMMMFFNLVINILINPGAIAVNEELNREAMSSSLLFSLVGILIYAPIVEELTFRAGFKKAFTGKISFAIFSALFFAILHLTASFDSFTWEAIINNWMQLLYILPYGALGFAFGFIYANTNNIYSTIIPHFCHNLLSVILILLATTLGG